VLLLGVVWAPLVVSPLRAVWAPFGVLLLGEEWTPLVASVHGRTLRPRLTCQRYLILIVFLIVDQASQDSMSFSAALLIVND
jgi:hypothetical protein